MDLDYEELDQERLRRNFIKYTETCSKGKDVPFEIYKNMYDDLCRYIDAYNRECADHEQTIQELYEEKESWRKKYFEVEDKEKKQELKEMIIGMLE